MAAIPLSEYAVHLRPSDNIAVARRPIPAGTELQIDGTTVKLSGAIKMGHKFAVRPVKEGDAISKYGQVIGFAGRSIGAGEHVHVHNVKLGSFERDYAHATATPGPLPPPAEFRTFMGFDRGSSKPDHLRYGTRNYVALISTVNCSASVCQQIRERFRDVQRDYPHVDGVIAIPKTGQRERLEDNAKALTHPLSAAQLKALDALFPPPQGPSPLAVL